MTLTGTDPITAIPGVGAKTADRVLDDDDALIRDFVTNVTVSRLRANKTEAANELRNATIEPFDVYSSTQLLFAKFRCTHRASTFGDDGNRAPIEEAVAAAPTPRWSFLGDRDRTPLPPEERLTIEPSSLVPAHYRTPGDQHKAVYLVTDESRVDDPNSHVHEPREDHIDTVVPARELDVIADLFGRTPSELLPTMRYEQDSPLHFSDPETGVEAMLPTATCPNRAGDATEWPQATREKADTTIYSLLR